MPRYFAHAKAIAECLKDVAGIEVLPNPPQTPMMHLLLRGDDASIRAAACRSARDRGIWTFGRTSPAQSPSMRIVEYGVGDASLTFSPKEIASLVGELVA
jgi:hypothetical protein